MIKSKVGFEAEFLLRNAKGELVIPPAYYDRDGFPLLGEIRGEEGKSPEETVSNFVAQKMKIIGQMRKGYSMQFALRERCPLKLYRAANKQIDYDEKAASVGKVLNINGVKIEDYSDQIVSRGKIQGVWISCGLHVHFSCEEKDETEVNVDEYEEVVLPISASSPKGTPAAEGNFIQEVMRPEIRLYRETGYETEKTLVARASKLNLPTREFIIRNMDNKFFDRFVADKKFCTKYRQPGFYELKPYGFEYRSLPFTEETEACLYEIAQYAFELLKIASSK